MHGVQPRRRKPIQSKTICGLCNKIWWHKILTEPIYYYIVLWQLQLFDLGVDYLFNTKYIIHLNTYTCSGVLQVATHKTAHKLFSLRSVSNIILDK